MAINADTLLDRLYLKSQITKWRVHRGGCSPWLALVVHRLSAYALFSHRKRFRGAHYV